MRALAKLVVLALLVGSSFGQGPPPKEIHSKTTIAPRSEPGERLVIAATVYDQDGKTLLPNVTLFVYHTDTSGVYGRPVNDSQHPRLRGWVKTDSQGRFELDTIKPGTYPEGGAAAHIHVMYMNGKQRADVDECWFEGDRCLTEGQKQRESAAGKFSRIVRLTKAADGSWRGEWNLRKKE